MTSIPQGLAEEASEAGKLGGRLSRLSRFWAALLLALMVINLGLAVRYIAITGDITAFLTHQLLMPVSIVTYVVLGALVIGRRPENPIGYLFLATGTANAFTALAAGITIYGSTLPATLSQVAIDTARWLDIWMWIPAVMLPVTFVFLYFPDGKLPSPRWRLPAWMAGLGLVAVVLGLALHPGPVEFWGTSENPFAVAEMEGFLEAVLNLGSLALVIGGISSIFAPFFRFFRSSGIVRQQMKWLAYAAVLVLILGVLSIPIWYLGGFSSPARLEASITLTNLVMMLIAVTVATAVIGYRLYDIDVLINRTLVYSLMTGAIVLIYVIIVGAAGIAFQSQGNWLLTLLATGLVAILFEPIRDRLQLAVNHLLYGQRDEPFEVMAQLGQSLEQSLSPASVYPMIVRTVARAMRLPYVAIQVPDGRRRRTVEAYGTSTNEPVSFDLTYQGETVGWLQVSPRSPNEAFSPADKRLLQNIALQAGAAVHNIRLTDDLQRSRQQIVTSREEERRRLRRDLHDGLGPSLASLNLEAGVLRRLIRENPDAAMELAKEMQGDIRATIDDIRRVVYALRPPALDDLGLVPAIQVLATKLGRGNGQGQSQSELQVQIEAPEELPPLPAAVEVAAYRIIHEALTNVVHHAGARCAIVRIWLEEDLHIVVEDDGVGLSGARAGGMGLLSMRERTDEISGRFAIAGRPAGGTIITVTLPVRTA